MENKTARLEAFSDGIFGVAITLLAIEIGINEYHDANNLNLWEKIISKWGEYFAYFNSFASVFLVWIGHNKIFEKIKKANHWVVLLNGLLLMFVVLFPFPTKTVGTFFFTPAINSAVLFYELYITIIVIAMLLLNLCILKSPQNIINPEKNIPWLKKQTKQQVSAIFMYCIATAFSFYYPYISLVISFCMWVFWAIITKENDDE